MAFCKRREGENYLFEELNSAEEWRSVVGREGGSDKKKIKMGIKRKATVRIKCYVK